MGDIGPAQQRLDVLPGEPFGVADADAWTTETIPARLTVPPPPSPIPPPQPGPVPGPPPPPGPGPGPGPEPVPNPEPPPGPGPDPAPVPSGQQLQHAMGEVVGLRPHYFPVVETPRERGFCGVRP